jgi:hypothetical protein
MRRPRVKISLRVVSGITPSGSFHTAPSREWGRTRIRRCGVAVENVQVRRWTRRDVAVVVGVQVIGFVVASFAFLYAFWSLPAEGLFGERNSGALRLTGAGAAAVCILGLASGLLEAWRRHRSHAALVLAGAVFIAGAIVSVGWALQLNLG